MERMLAGENIEFFVEYCSETNVTKLIGLDCNVLVPLITLLISKQVSIRTVLLDLAAKILNLPLVVFKALTQVLFHFFYLGFFGEFFK